MSKTKQPDERWPRIWHGNVPAESQVDDEDSYSESIEDEETFHIGQCYENNAAQMQRCKICGSTEFNVGCGCYMTVLRCTKCEWEECIHDG